MADSYDSSETLSISGDGGTIALGINSLTDRELIIVYHKVADNWIEEMIFSEDHFWDFGNNLELSEDGSILVTGMSRDANHESGSVIIYESNGHFF